MTNTATESNSGMYQQLTALDREAHANLKIKPATDLLCATELLIVPLVIPEFFDVSREYPIVFIRDARQLLMTVAVTGVPNGKNLFVDAAGKWHANYIPAYVRNHPFALARTAPDTLTVCFDEASNRFSNDEGEAIFAAGQPTPMMQQVFNRLNEYENQAQFTVSFAQKLEAAGLLRDADARADLQGQQFAVQGFQIIDEARLRALPEATVKEWFSSGELGLIYAHLISLGNFMQLLRGQSLLMGAPAGV